MAADESQHVAPSTTNSSLSGTSADLLTVLTGALGYRSMSGHLAPESWAGVSFIGVTSPGPRPYPAA
jgi:hypothetical protein